MVKVCHVWIGLLFFWHLGFAVHVQMEVEGTPMAGQPIQVLVTLERSPEVEAKHFEIDDHPVQLELLYNTRQSSLSIINGVRKEKNSLISTYRFSIPGKIKGIHTLSPISVEVDGKRYYSNALTYEVETPVFSKDFFIETYVKTHGVIYPGSKVDCIVRIFTKFPCQFLRMDFPLLDPATGFKKVGQERQRTYTREGYTVMEKAQPVRALEPGVYSMGASHIEVIRYRMGSFGEQIQQPPTLLAEAPSFEVTIRPFPEMGKPDFFGGALGDFTIRTELASPTDTFFVGDKIEMKVVIDGSGDFDTVNLALEKLYSGLARHFRFSDIPPSGDMIDRKKVFYIDLRPLSAEVKEIPELAFASFDPEQEKYVISRSDPIPIHVLLENTLEPSLEKGAAELTHPKQEEKTNHKEEIEQMQKAAFQIKVAPASPIALQALNNDRPRWNLLWIIPIGLGVVAFQLALYQAIKKKHAKGKPPSYVYMKRAKRAQSREAFFGFIEKSLVKLAQEKLHDASIISFHQLPPVGSYRELRIFLQELEKNRYQNQKSLSTKKIWQEAKSLYQKIKREK